MNNHLNFIKKFLILHTLKSIMIIRKVYEYYFYTIGVRCA